MSATVATALALARAEIGYVAPSQGSKFGREIGIGAGAWCAAFTSVILRKAGLTAGTDFPVTAWTPNIVSWGRNNGRLLFSDPRPGDLVLYMWPGLSTSGRGTPPVCHVGFVEAVQADGSLVTIEGNTSGTVGGSQYNGGTVQRKVRRSYIQCYVRPNYSDAVSTWYAGGLGSRVILPGVQGDDVQSWQALLNLKVVGAGAPLEEDGVNGPLTQERTKVLQTLLGLEPDGIPGPLTFDASLAKPSAPTPAPAPAPAPSRYSGALGSRVLMAGMEGDDVAALQVFLNDHVSAWPPLDPDGDFGPLTKRSLRTLQAIAKARHPEIEVDGVAGPQVYGIVSNPAGYLNQTATIVERTQALVHVAVDNVWGPNTDNGILAVRYASRWAGNKFPFGVSFLRARLGIFKVGGKTAAMWRAHDLTVEELRKVWGLPESRYWDGKMEAKWQALRSLFRKS